MQNVLNSGLIAWSLLFGYTASAVPLEILESNYGGARLSTDVLIDGQSQHMLLDTGSNISAIAPTESNGQFQKQQSARSFGAYGEGTCDLVDVPSFTIDQMTLKHQRLARCANSPFGVVGIDVLNDQIWKLDFTNKQLIVAPPTSVADQPLSRTYYNSIEVPVTITGAPGESQTALFDTGAELGSVDVNYVDQHRNLFDIVGVQRIQDSTGKQVTELVVQLTQLKVGGVQFDNVFFFTTDFKMLQQKFDPNLHFVLGANLIRRKNWILD